MPCAYSFQNPDIEASKFLYRSLVNNVQVRLRSVCGLPERRRAYYSHIIPSPGRVSQYICAVRYWHDHLNLESSESAALSERALPGKGANYLENYRPKERSRERGLGYPGSQC